MAAGSLVGKEVAPRWSMPMVAIMANDGSVCAHMGELDSFLWAAEGNIVSQDKTLAWTSREKDDHGRGTEPGGST